MLKTRISRLYPAVLALTAFGGTMYATSPVLTATSPVAVTCNTLTGPGTAATISIKSNPALVTPATLTITVGSQSGGVVVTPPSPAILTTTNQTGLGVVFSINAVAGCTGMAAGSTTVTFSATGATPVTVTVNTTLTSNATALVTSPSTLTVNCTLNGSTYTPAPAQTVSVTSLATGGTPFTVDTVTNAPPAWLTVTPTTGGTANGTAVPFTIAAASGCGGFSVGTSNPTTIHLLNSPAPDKLLPVTLKILGPAPLSASPSPASISYTKGSGATGYVDVRITSGASPAPFFAVDTASLPIWLNVDSTTGTTPKSIRFSNTSVADTLAPGDYSATVRLNVSGYGAMLLPINLLVNNPTPKLTVAEGTTRNINWTVGQSLPTPYITAVSTDSPIPYSIATAGTLNPIVSPTLLKGLAYNFGTAIPVTFDPLLFAAATPGSVLTGTVTLTWGTPASTIVVTFNVSVLSPGATLTALSPASIPTSTTTGQIFTLGLSGTGFVPSTDPTQKTKVGIVVNNAIISDTNIAVNVINPSNIILTITVPAVADTYLPFSTGGTVNLGVCNPSGGSCVLSGQLPMLIGNVPIIQGVTSASAFIQVTPPALQTVAPYDLISIFGSNFCSSGGTGCASNTVLTGSPDPVTLRYPASLSPDAAGSTQRLLTVNFQTHATPPVLIGTAASLLFSTNNQINVLVPAALSAQIGNSVDIVVNFGYGSGATMKSSLPFTVSVVGTNPGIFTVGSDGQGDGAILGSNWATISNSNPAGIRSTALGADSDTVQVYMTGLGAPDATGDNSAAGNGPNPVWSTDCITPASYITTLAAQTGVTIPSIDGTIIQSSLFNTYRMAPCVDTSSTNLPTATVGGQPATVTYAGWVADSVAGLYQVNLRLPPSTAASGTFTTATGATPTTITVPVQLPVVITSNSKTSQSNVTLWVAPRLKLVAPTALSGTVGTAWAGSNNLVVASLGTAPYRYIVTSGVLPSGLSLTGGAISGTPAANTAGSYVITVTAIDSAQVPVTGTVTFTLNIAGGLVLSAPGARSR